jgi:hypothetical protein
MCAVLAIVSTFGGVDNIVLWLSFAQQKICEENVGKSIDFVELKNEECCFRARSNVSR